MKNEYFQNDVIDLRILGDIGFCVYLSLSPFKYVNSSKNVNQTSDISGKEKLKRFLTKHSASNQNSVDNLLYGLCRCYEFAWPREDLSCRTKRVKKDCKERWEETETRGIAPNVEWVKYRRNPFGRNLQQTLMGR